MFKEVPANKISLAARKPVFGFGVNDSTYKTEIKVNGKRFFCPIYIRWKNMIKRCYSASFHKIQPTYKDCSVCEEWLTFSNFKAWMIKQNWQDRHLDKDIIITGNKVYSPEMCIFISKEINSLLGDNAAIRGDYPRGVSLFVSSNKFRAGCSVNGKLKHIGYFDNQEDTSKAYKKFKSNHVKEVALKQNEPLKGYLLRIANEIKSIKEK